MRKKASIVLSLLLLVKIICAQQDSVKLPNYKARKLVLLSGGAVLTAGSLVFLSQEWYSQYNTGSFHFFNDNKEWLQMDKIGHGFTTYQTSRLMMGACNWAGLSKKQCLWIGGSSGFVYMTAIEVMDGFSRGWGFSWGDELANMLGSGIAIAEQIFWNEQRIQLKFSYSQSGLAKYNPDLLGKNNYSQVLKDYNGQTYWLSINPSSFLNKGNKFPKWLNIALGYSAYGMLGAFDNTMVLATDNLGNVLKIDRQRRFYLSLDLDLTRIRTRSKTLKRIFSVINILKFPAPALQFSKSGIRAYGIYY